MTRDVTGIDPVALAREASGKATYQDSPAKQKRKVRGTPGPIRKGLAPAQASASVAGQQWHDLGVAHGFELPYDANWVAHQIQARFDADGRMQRLKAEGREADAWRLVAKMIEVWWKRYVNEEVNRKNAADYFLRVDWEDCQDFAYSTLRAIYLRDHGKRVAPPEVDRETMEAHQQRLREVADDKRINEFIGQVDMDATPPQLDESRRERLRSFVEGHRQKRSKK